MIRVLPEIDFIPIPIKTKPLSLQERWAGDGYWIAGNYKIYKYNKRGNVPGFLVPGLTGFQN